MSSPDLIDLLLKSSEPAKLLIQIASARPFLHSAELAIADYILKHPRQASRCTAQQLAERTSTSEASLFRFCRTFGLSGITDLRNQLEKITVALESAALTSAIETDDWNQCVQAAIAAIVGTTLILDPDTLSQAGQAVADSTSVSICGMGPFSARIAEMLAFSFQEAGIASFAWVDARVEKIPDDFIDADNAVVGISHSGTNEEVANFLARAGRNGAVTIALTNYPASIVGSNAKYILNTGVCEDSFQMTKFIPRIGELLILSCLVQQVKKCREQAEANRSSLT